MKVIILGCGRVGSTLARLLADRHDVTVVDRTSEAFRRLGNKFKGEKLVGPGTDMDVLKRAGIVGADAVVTCTDGDNRNIMAAQIAKETFSVPLVIARIYDPSRAAVYQEMGIRTFCPTALAAGLFADMIEGREPASLVDPLQRYLDAARTA
jgi:trk system potassium uptake protein